MGRQILEQVRDQLKTCNAVRSDREFCEQWLGKSECYLRTLRCGNLSPSADAMMTCASKLHWYAQQLSGRHNHIMCIGLMCLSDCALSV